MILGVNFANSCYRKAQQLNTWSMYNKGHVDKVIEYSPDSLDDDFSQKNQEILSCKRGGGYWLWKPYILLKSLSLIDNGDYLLYLDSGCVILDSVSLLIQSMEDAGQDVMAFELRATEKTWSKRDAFIIMDCDSPKYSETNQRLGGYILIKKSDHTVNICKQFLFYAEHYRIITDEPNTMGLPNYDGFIENRHDQTIWSLLTKKNNILPFRDPSQYGSGEKE